MITFLTVLNVIIFSIALFWERIGRDVRLMRLVPIMLAISTYNLLTQNLMNSLGSTLMLGVHLMFIMFGVFHTFRFFYEISEESSDEKVDVIKYTFLRIPYPTSSTHSK